MILWQTDLLHFLSLFRISMCQIPIHTPHHIIKQFSFLSWPTHVIKAWPLRQKKKNTTTQVVSSCEITNDIPALETFNWFHGPPKFKSATMERVLALSSHVENQHIKNMKKPAIKPSTYPHLFLIIFLKHGIYHTSPSQDPNDSRSSWPLLR